jgi:hypothetical protein
VAPWSTGVYHPDRVRTARQPHSPASSLVYTGQGLTRISLEPTNFMRPSSLLNNLSRNSLYQKSSGSLVTAARWAAFGFLRPQGLSNDGLL